ncbi:hypothetical protein [Oribacterium sp. WCC10]|uniref:hypothetical protein n=1 Tax=Oribacterium sp. WCC10 TaxID=1855343 RepID=UPI0008EA9004|nr:hypothetical protein [Oribacterium sp. WCC10]SFG45807.1 hypothetical protein SAMN05216356_10980 [Oribacterium sp. WCC10]
MAGATALSLWAKRRDMEEITVKIRRYKKNIEVSGRAMLAFAIWSVLKGVITIALGGKTVWELMEVSEADKEELGMLLLIVYFILILIAFLLFVYIGRRAISYARDKHRKKGFLIAAAILLILDFIGIPGYFTTTKGLENIDTAIASALVDITTCFALFDMIYSAIRIEKLRADNKVTDTV